MLARTFPSLLPDLQPDDALEVAALYSLRGTLRERPPSTLRPTFRSPHHSISRAGLVGGGTGLVQPGEISLAHASVQFAHQRPGGPSAELKGTWVLVGAVEHGWPCRFPASGIGDALGHPPTGRDECRRS
jgi:hypothetical protein